jgi:hypothetical protein
LAAGTDASSKCDPGPHKDEKADERNGKKYLH